MESKRLRVIIVGGSVAGLTLANCLSKTDIDYVVLESHADIAPQVGASIGILPNGARILDQLGMFDDTLATVEPLRENILWTGEGKNILRSRSPMVVHERHGYPVSFLDRQILLQILYDHLDEGKERVHVGKKFVRVDQLAKGVLVHCADGSVFEGDLVVGADGVRSTVRQEMWRHMELQGMQKEVAKERAQMTSEYNCVFGISTATPGLNPGESHRTYAKDHSFLVIVGKEGRVFWFLFTKMAKRYSAADIPRFSKEDMEAHLEKYADTKVTATVSLRDIRKNVVTNCLVPLEEACYKHWSMDRIVCVGDSIHKMTPNMGQGGNSAIESAALLANQLQQLIKTHADPRIASAISSCLRTWQNDRESRACNIAADANELTRIEACATPKHLLIAHYLLPYIQEYLLNKTSRSIVGAEKLDFLPLPPRALQCKMPYTTPERPSPDGGIAKRGLWASPLLGCYGVARVTMGGVIQNLKPHFVPFFQQGFWAASNGEVLSLREPVYNVELMDKILSPLILCFLPSISGSDLASRAQMITFLTDLGPVYGIWLLESYRKGHSWAEVFFPTLMGVAFQLKGIGKIAPLYYAIEYIRHPLSKLLKADNGVMKSSALASLLPALLAGYYLPTFANFFAPTVEDRRLYNAIWQLFPVVVPLLQLPFRLLSRPAPNPEQQEKIKKSKFYLRATYLTMATLSTIAFIYARCTAPADTSVTDLFFPSLNGHSEPITSFAQGIARFLQYDQVLSVASSFIWLGLRFRELKKSGASFSWLKAIGAGIVTTLTCGPGAALALGWGWREEMIADL